MKRWAWEFLGASKKADSKNYQPTSAGKSKPRGDEKTNIILKRWAWEFLGASDKASSKNYQPTSAGKSKPRGGEKMHTALKRFGLIIVRGR